MFQATVKEFIKVVQANEELQEKVKTVNSPASLIKLAAENGYEFTEQELQPFWAELKAEEELSDEQLLSVAGGLLNVDPEKSCECGQHTCSC